jgi:predicted ATPase/class 3 adenylate cyclase
MGDQPSTRLTMLFSDIEGSTLLLNQLGPTYPDVLATHRRILRRAFDAEHGREVGTEGDSFFVVFDSAADAAEAAAEGQQALEGHEWPDGVAVRVRMGLHTGCPEAFEDNWVGLDVHVAARVCATAHGGQVVMSSATVDDLGDHLPPGATVVDLGPHRLKDIVEPQRLSQLVVPGLPATFPPLRSLGTPGNLPTSPAPLVGRDSQLADVTSLVTAGASRMVTLTGPGGAGKTRLSISAAERLAPSFLDGVHFVDLSAATDDSVAWRELAETLGRSGESEVELLEHLRDRNVLLVLDNLEQLPRSGAAVVTKLVGATSRLRVLATSRRPLRVAGEQDYPVPPLSLPAADEARATVEVASQAESVRLFVQQARLTDPDFALTADNVEDVVSVCRRLDGLPLAVELAAARVRLLSARGLLDHLDEALALPLPGHPERQQTLTATVTWSYRMVVPDQQRAFRALAVFGTGGGTFDAVATVAGVPSSLSAVSGLLDAALVRVDDDPAGPRIRLLQPVRTVARALATDGREVRDFQRRLARHYLDLAERAAERMKGPDAIAARASIEREMDNLREVLEWSLGDRTTGDPEDETHDGTGESDETRVATGIRLSTALGWYWYVTGYDAESRRWLERASRAAVGQQGPQLAELLHSFALLFLQQGDDVRARDMVAKALVLWQRAGDRSGEAKALNSLGVVYRSLGDTARARALLQQSVDLAQATQDLQRLATVLTNLALLEIDAGHPGAALPLLAEAERLDLGMGNAWGVAADRVNRVAALLASSRTDEAMVLLRELAASVTDHGDPDLTLGVVEMLAYAASTVGDHARAVRLAACADEQRTVDDLPLTDVDRAFLERQLALSRQALGAAADELERQGRTLQVSSALAEALDITLSRASDAG